MWIVQFKLLARAGQIPENCADADFIYGWYLIRLRVVGVWFPYPKDEEFQMHSYTYSNYAKGLRRQGDRNRESDDNEAESRSDSVIDSGNKSMVKVTHDCNACSSDCSDCSDEIEADLDPSTWNGRLSLSWQSLDKGTQAALKFFETVEQTSQKQFSNLPHRVYTSSSISPHSSCTQPTSGSFGRCDFPERDVNQ